MNNEFITRISYEQLRQIIFDYFKEHDNIELNSISIEYLRDLLTENGKNSTAKFFIMRNELGESRFNIPKEDIEKILKDYLEKKNFGFVSVSYSDFVNITYRMQLSLADNQPIQEEQNNKTYIMHI